MNEKYNIGDWIYIIRAQEGAYGANDNFAKIIKDSPKDSPGNSSGCREGLYVKLYPSKCTWCIGNNYIIRHALKHELRDFLIMCDDYKDNTSYLIPILKKYNIK